MVNVVLEASATIDGDRASNDPIIAAIDIGTNSIHMVIVRIVTSLPAFSTIAREKETVRLGDRDPLTGNLTPEAIERAFGALKRCQEVAKSLNVRQIFAVATSAVREAPNGHEFVRSIEAELGLAVNIISGQEEARRIYLGVLSGVEFNNTPHIIIDIGGGSTELILGDTHEPRTLSSTKIGAVRLTGEFIPNNPVSDRALLYLQAFVRGQLERAIDEIKANLQPGEMPKMIGTSGTIETLATILSLEKNGHVPDRVHGSGIHLAELRNLINRLRRMTVAERTAIEGISERRAEIIVAGAVVLQEAMTLLGMQHLSVCERSLREGVIVDWMLTQGLIEDRLKYQGSIRERSTLKIAGKYGVDLPHSERVAELALSLFDQTYGQIHTWDKSIRQLLWSAAILHNSGHFVSHDAHHKHSYYLIRYGELLGFSESEIDIIANVARYHRKSPPKKKHQNLQNLSKEQRSIVSQLSAILRVAVALDRRRIGAIKDVRLNCDLTSRECHLTFFPTDPTDACVLECWSLDYKKPIFETEFNLKLSTTKG
ncbi:Ppx/GppA phosphatase family protein [Chamaesiphon minutus]|uniref:Exopolyphosphatase n=1 Tax=Chamaesiphon minutus (strain ATCC 27169 / PCC 6605) TaxID=1173020 RepID=K9UJC1_CHAP6|nr:Ppx/GppA phosphatase family protein [Chamaesiphon minutus]AFY94905.1 exopolyphosphatase [Chamaesiphon minutus PCC 6605]